MTPPSSRLSGDAPVQPYPIGTGVNSFGSAEKPALLKPVDSFVKLDDTAPAFASVQDLLLAMGDEQLFGSVANAKYQPERNKKYLKVTMALMEIRKYLRGDEKNSSVAPKRIEEWLSDPELLGDTVVAHQARVNLIKVLKKAPKDATIDDGVKAMLAALAKNYAPQAQAPKPSEASAEDKPKDVSALLSEITDTKLFAEKFADYDVKRNQDFLSVSLALLEVRKFIRGDSGEAETAKAKIAAWLNDYNLLTGEIPHRARVALIKALENAPSQSEAWNKGIQEIVATLKAKYSPAKPEPAPEPPKGNPKPKEETPKPDEKPPPKDPPPADKPKVEDPPKALSALYLFNKFTFAMKEKREDTDMSLVKTVMATLRPTIDPLQAKDPEFTLETDMFVKVNNETGEVVEISFKDPKIQGKTKVEEVESALQNMAERFHTRYRFVRGKEDKKPVTTIEIPLTFAKKKP